MVSFVYFSFFYIFSFLGFCFFFFKQKTAYEMRISDWSSDVCSSDLPADGTAAAVPAAADPRPDRALEARQRGGARREDAGRSRHHRADPARGGDRHVSLPLSPRRRKVRAALQLRRRRPFFICPASAARRASAGRRRSAVRRSASR